MQSCHINELGTLCSCGEHRHFFLPQYVNMFTLFIIVVLLSQTVSQKWLHFHPNDFMNGTFLLSVFPNKPGFQPSVIAQPCCSHRLNAFAQAPICIRLFGFVCSRWHFLLSHKAAAIILGVKGAPRNARPSAPRTAQSTCVCYTDATQTQTHRNLKQA